MRKSVLMAGVLSLGLALAGPALAKKPDNNQSQGNGNGNGQGNGNGNGNGNGQGGGVVFLGGCQNSDILTAGGATLASDCNGFYEKNTLGSNDDATTTAALLDLGLVWNGVVLEAINLGDSNPTVNFASLLSGTTYIGIHWGKGNGPVDTQGGVSAYYRLNLTSDAELDAFKTAFGSNSGARLYSTQACSGPGCGNTGGGIPEPSTWGMMLLGFAGAGHLIRRRRYDVA